MARTSRVNRKLDDYQDKGEYYWEDYISIIKVSGSSRLAMLLQKALHPDMLINEGYIRIETWLEGERESPTKCKASVRYDVNFVIYVLSERYRELGMIDGALFAKDRIDKLTTMIQADHAKEKDREVQKALIEAAQALVRAGVYDDVETALQSISKEPATKGSNGKSARASSKASVADTADV